MVKGIIKSKTENIKMIHNYMKQYCAIYNYNDMYDYYCAVYDESMDCRTEILYSKTWDLLFSCGALSIKSDKAILSCVCSNELTTGNVYEETVVRMLVNKAFEVGTEIVETIVLNPYSKKEIHMYTKIGFLEIGNYSEHIKLMITRESFYQQLCSN